MKVSNNLTLWGVLVTYFSHIPDRISCGGAANEEDFLADVGWREEGLDVGVFGRFEAVEVVEAMVPRV